jgi:hypothetical protein
MITVTCCWKTNDDVMREVAQGHRIHTIERQIADAEGSIVLTLAREACEYRITCSEAWCGRHIQHLLDCDRLTIEASC